MPKHYNDRKDKGDRSSDSPKQVMPEKGADTGGMSPSDVAKGYKKM